MGSVQGGERQPTKSQRGPEEDGTGVRTSIFLGTSNIYSILAHFTVFQGGERALVACLLSNMSPP